MSVKPDLKSAIFTPALESLTPGTVATVFYETNGFEKLWADVYTSFNGTRFMRIPLFDADCHLWVEITEEERQPLQFWSISTNPELLNEMAQLVEMEEDLQVEEITQKPLDLEAVQQAIANECNEIRDFLIDKNRLYGNSALEPMRIFSAADPIEQINVRLDDKLSRLVSGQLDDTEEVEDDFLGYLILKRVAKKMHNIK